METPAQGVAELEGALSLNRNIAAAHAHTGLAKLYLGLGEETEVHIQEAIRLSPRDRGACWWAAFAGIAKLYLGKDEEAVGCGAASSSTEMWWARCLRRRCLRPDTLRGVLC
jgi:hypothetical protein